MRQRQRRIIAILSGSEDWTSGRDIACELGVSLRTVQMDVRRINESGAPLQIESNNRLGYRLSEDVRQSLSMASEFVAELVLGAGKNLFESQVITTLLFESGWTSIDQVARRLYVSRSTVNAHLPAVRRIVPRSGNAEFQAVTGKGIRIVAEERDCRSMCMKMFETDFEPNVFLGVGNFEGLRRDVARLRGLLTEILAGQPYLFTGPAFSMLVNLIVITIMRSCFGFVLPGQAEPSANPYVRKISDAVFREFGYAFTSVEEHELQTYLRNMSLMECGPVADAGESSLPPAEDWHVSSFVRAVERLCGVSLSYEEDVARAFERHVRRMLGRLESGMVYRGKETPRIFGRRPFAVHLLRVCLEPLLGVHIPDAELGYLVPYVAHALERCRPRLHTLLVTDESVGRMLDVKRVIEWCAQEVHGCVKVVPSYVFLHSAGFFERSFDLIVTTEPAIAYKHEHVVLVGGTGEQRGRDIARWHMQHARALLDERYADRMRCECPVGDISTVTLGALAAACEGGDIDEIGAAIGASDVRGQRALSLETVGSSRLTIVARTVGSGSCVRRAQCEPFWWDGKRIREVVLFQYSDDVDPVAFFQYAREELERLGCTY